MMNQSVDNQPKPYIQPNDNEYLCHLIVLINGWLDSFGALREILTIFNNDIEHC